MEVHALAVEQDNRGAILLIRKGGASYRNVVPPYCLHNRIAVDLQQNSYRFLTTPQPSAAMLPMLHREHAWEGGCL